MSEHKIVTVTRTDPPNDQDRVIVDRHLTILLRVMSPLAQVLVRTVRTFLQSMIGMLGVATVGRPVAENIGVIVPAGELSNILWFAVYAALFPTVVSFLHNSYELLNRWDEKYPKARA